MNMPSVEEWYGRELSKLALSEGHRGGIPGDESSLEEQQVFRDNLGKYRPLMECVAEGPVYFRAISKISGITLTTLHRRVKKMVGLGYVTTGKSQWKLGVLVTATKKGLEELEAYDGAE